MTADGPAATRIRPVRLRDAPRIQALVADPAIAATTMIPWPYPEDGAERFVDRMLDAREAGTDFVFAIETEGRLVGVCGLHGVAGSPPTVELGYWIGKAYWGRGHGAAAAGAAVRWAFASLPVERITAHCLERNGASRRILEGLGFHEAARAPSEHPRWAPADLVIRYELARHRWRDG